MPLKNESSNLYYSFDVGLIHFVSYNTEAYFNMTGNGAASGDVTWACEQSGGE